MNILSGSKVLEEVESQINGKVTVIKSLGFGTYLKVGSLTQSGGVIYSVWKATLLKLKKKKSGFKDCLILGLGGGSAASLVRKYWPVTVIDGVDIDPVMINLGKKYLNLKAENIYLEDAEDYCKRAKGKGKKYELILVDMYIGDHYPEKFEKDGFIALVKDILGKEGVAVFNRLYYGKKRKEAAKFGEKLDKAFKKVERVYPEANLMFVCFR